MDKKIKDLVINPIRRLKEKIWGGWKKIAFHWHQ
jgi:hypothetical protein